MHKNLKNIVCEVPFTEFQIYENGMVSNCCFTWLPKAIGNINQSSLLQLYQSQVSNRIRESILCGSYEYCEETLCPRLSAYLNNDKLDLPLHSRSNQIRDFDLASEPSKERMIRVFLNYDKSCNLQCPSCRSSKLLYKIEDLPESLKQTHENALKSVHELLDAGFRVSLNITGSGDPFASLLYWNFLKELDPHPNLLLTLQTNGLLMNEERLLPNIRKITEFLNVSVDAATEPTYNKVRKGGAFKKLLKNVRSFDELVARGDFPSLSGWQMNFIVQEDNFSEIVPFTEWALTHDTVKVIWFNLIADWGHLSKADFEKKAIWMETHERHRDFLEVLKSPILKHPKVMLGNMSAYV